MLPDCGTLVTIRVRVRTFTLNLVGEGTYYFHHGVEMTAQPDSGRHSAPAANGRTDIHSLIEFHAGPPGGDATRHLSAAAYLDRDFRTKVIAELVENRYRVPAPTPGIEADRVLDHCLRARRAAVVTGSATIAIGLLGLMISPFAVLIVLVMAVLLRGTRAAASTIAGPCGVGPDRHRPVGHGACPE